MNQHQRKVLFKIRRDLRASYDELHELCDHPPIRPDLLRGSGLAKCDEALVTLSGARQWINRALNKPLGS